MNPTYPMYNQPSYSPYTNLYQTANYANRLNPTYPPPVQQPMLHGAMVPSVESITADAVPMDGSVAIFPKQDLSEIYVKSWNPDGTIKTLTFRPVENPTAPSNDVFAQIKELNQKINNLEATINKNKNRNYRKENNQE